MRSDLVIMATAIGIFAAQATASYTLRREPYLPSPPPLDQLPPSLDHWVEQTEETVDAEALDALAPDDSLARIYRRPDGSESAELFVAYYKTQLRTKNAHDPKVCLPGAGWNPVASRVLNVTDSGSARSFPVNYYRVAKGNSQEVVVYWFQTFRGVYTSEQQLRVHRVWDSIIDNRTDMALVRIIVPVTAPGLSAADSDAVSLARNVYTSMLPYFPATMEKTRA